MSPATSSRSEAATPLVAVFRRLVARMRGAPAAPEPRPIPAKQVSASAVGRGYEAHGYRKGTRRIVVTVDGDLFKRVRADAVKSGVSLAAEVRDILTQHYAAKEPRQEQ